LGNATIESGLVLSDGKVTVVRSSDSGINLIEQLPATDSHNCIAGIAIFAKLQLFVITDPPAAIGIEIPNYLSQCVLRLQVPHRGEIVEQTNYIEASIEGVGTVQHQAPVR